MKSIQLWSDFSSLGLYLFPFVKSGCYGLNDEKGMFLFVLDIHKKIHDRAYHAYLSLFWRGSYGDVYILSPTQNHSYLTSSEILHRLGVSIVSPPPTKTVEHLQQDFKEALKDDYFKFIKYLTDSQPLLRNTNGDMVYDSFLGRYIYATQQRSQKGRADGDFLYAVNADADIDRQALVQCAKAYLLDFSQKYDNIDDFKSIVFRKPTKDIVISETLDLSNKLIDKLEKNKEVTPLQSISFDNALRQAEASIVYDLVNQKNKNLALFKEVFYDTLKLQTNTIVKQVKKNKLPHLNMPLSLALSYLLTHNSDDKIYSDSVGNLTMLAALGSVDVMVLFNSLKNDIDLYNQHHNQNIDIYDSSYTKPFNRSFSIYPSGFNHIEVILPIINPDGKLIVNRTVDSLALSRIITMLQNREQQGRSLFLIPCDDFGELGDYFEFFAWLQCYYNDVGIFDLSKDLFFNDIDPVDMRIIIVGSEKSPRPKNLTEFNHRIKDISATTPTRIINNYEQLFELCQEVVTRELSKPYLIKHYPNVDTDINVNIFHQISVKLKEVNDIDNALINKEKPDEDDGNAITISGAFINLTKQSFLEQSTLNTNELIVSPHLENHVNTDNQTHDENVSTESRDNENNSTGNQDELITQVSLDKPANNDEQLQASDNKQNINVSTDENSSKNENNEINSTSEHSQTDSNPKENQIDDDLDDENDNSDEQDADIDEDEYGFGDDDTFGLTIDKDEPELDDIDIDIDIDIDTDSKPELDFD